MNFCKQDMIDYLERDIKIHYEVWDGEKICNFVGKEANKQGEFPTYSNALRFIEGMAYHFGVSERCFDVKQVNSIGESTTIDRG